jgi:hypothetical protein
MRYICAQPASQYYTWQVEVLINNFKKHGINPNHIDILCATEDGIVSEDWKKLQAHYNTIRFFFYKDTRIDKSYIPSIYFNLMKQHISAHPELREERLFLHDSDIIFTRPPELDWIKDSDSIWYLSNTNSYINFDYIQQKGNDIYEDMCAIIGIDKVVPKLMNSNSGGAQYIVKGEGYSFWDKVENDSIKLYKYFCDRAEYDTKNMKESFPIQKWTAGMWSLLWNAWKNGHETKVDPRLDFGWSTNNISDVEKYWILHNAGVTSTHVGLFYKGAYIDKLPYNEQLEIDPDKASYYYWKEVQETSKQTILI